MAECKPPSKFQLENEDKLYAVLEEVKGSGWKADLVRNIEVCMYSENSPLFIILTQGSYNLHLYLGDFGCLMIGM